MFIALYIVAAAYLCGAVWATIWVAASFAECRCAAKGIAREKEVPASMVMLFLVVCTVVIWPLLVVGIARVKRTEHDT